MRIGRGGEALPPVVLPSRKGSMAPEWKNPANLLGRAVDGAGVRPLIDRLTYVGEVDRSVAVDQCVRRSTMMRTWIRDSHKMSWVGQTSIYDAADRQPIDLCRFQRDSFTSDVAGLLFETSIAGSHGPHDKAAMTTARIFSHLGIDRKAVDRSEAPQSVRELVLIRQAKTRTNQNHNIQVELDIHLHNVSREHAVDAHYAIKVPPLGTTA